MNTGHSISGGGIRIGSGDSCGMMSRVRNFFFSKVQVRIVAVPSSTAYMRPSSSCRSCVGLRSAWFWRSGEDAWIRDSAGGRAL